MEALVTSFVWGNGIDKDNEELCRHCPVRASIKNNPPKYLYIPRQFQTLHGNNYI